MINGTKVIDSKNFRVSDYIVECLVNNGVKDVFLLPGGGCMHIVDSFALNNKINIISCNHEQAASIAAESYGRVSKKASFGVCCVTSGPGATNALTGVAGAWIESLPLLVISGQVKRKDMIGKRKIRQGGVQEVDITSMIKPISKFSRTIMNIEDVKDTMAMVFQHLSEGRKGPVWLDIPLDIQAAPYIKKHIPKPIFKIKKSLRTIDLSKFKKSLEQSKRPLTIAGHGVRIDDSQQLLCDFIKKNNIPLLVTWNAMDMLPFEHKLYAGRPGVVAKRFANFSVQNCDLLISIGSRLDNVITAYNPKNFAPLAKKFIIDIDKNELANCQVNGEKYNIDAHSFLCEANKLVTNKPKRNAWIKQIADWKKKYQNEFLSQKTTNGRFTHFQAVEALSNSLPEKALICTGSSGLAIESFYVGFKNKKHQRIFLTSGLGAMGYGLPSAIGACVANQRKRTYLVESDGSMLLNLQELATVRSYSLPLTIILMNNSGYASIRNTQRNYFQSRFVGTGKETGNFYPSFKSISKVFGLKYFLVKNEDDLLKAINNSKKYRHACIIDIMIKKDEQLAPKVSAMPQKDGSMISMPLEDMNPLLPIKVLENEMQKQINDLSYEIRKNKG